MLNPFVKSFRKFNFLKTFWVKRAQRKIIEKWRRSGCPVPPPHIIKQLVLQQYAKNYGLKVLVETGTYYGDMVEAMLTTFEKIYSIELSDALYAKALKRFDGIGGVRLIHGDSGKEIEKIVEELTQPALFWLDGHYSAGLTARGDKDTPICEELNAILSGKHLEHVIIIDDARCFGTDPSYPTLLELESFVKARRPDVNIMVRDDSIRINLGSVGSTNCPQC